MRLTRGMTPLNGGRPNIRAGPAKPALLGYTWENLPERTNPMRLIRILLIVLIALLTACAPKADYDIRGTWEYTLTAADGNTYDAGLVTFNGEAASGTLTEVNIYQVEYEGTYAVRGSAVEIVVDGDEIWKGSFSGDAAMSGTWEGPDGAFGTWTATRKP